MRQYAVITNLESERAVHYTLSSLPLHVTILSIFFSDEQPLLFSETLGALATKTRSINTRTTGRALFGVNEDIPVTLVKKTKELNDLHQQRLKAVSEYVSFRAPQFTGRNFGPHITNQQDRSVPEETDLLLDNLSLVEIIDQDVLVRSIHHLSAAT